MRPQLIFSQENYKLGAMIFASGSSPLSFPCVSRLPLSKNSALRLTILSLTGVLLLPAAAQPTGASPDAEPSPAEAPLPLSTAPQEGMATPNSIAPDQQTTEPATPASANATTSDATSRLTAPHLSYEGATVIAQGKETEPVKFQNGNVTLTAHDVKLDTITGILDATGEVRLERERQIERNELRPNRLQKRTELETVHEIAFGQNLHLDIRARKGQLDHAQLELAQLSFASDKLLINGQSYTIQGATVRPGGLTPEELKIYGTPPLNLRAREITVTRSNNSTMPQVQARGAALFFKNTRLFPVPSYLFQRGDGTQNAYSLTPKISFNSADRVFLSTRLTFPLERAHPEKLALFSEIGLSERVGFRGGAGVESQGSYGDLSLGAHYNDVVTKQLTNRLEVDRLPELRYRSPAFLTFNLPGNRQAGFTFEGNYGYYRERLIDSDTDRAKSSRLLGQLSFTTRLKSVDGPFLRLFSSIASYGSSDENYRSTGYEVGYDGQLLPRVRGQISFRDSNLNGSTPFLFDKVEIRREARATVDVSLSPRYIVPVDLRYDLAESRFRDTTFGLLRSYKTFAYGLVYQSARQDLRLEVRSGF